MIQFVLFALIGYLLFSYLRPWFRAVALAFSLPGPDVFPFVSNIFAVDRNKDILGLLVGAYRNYGPIYRDWISLAPVIVVLEPKYVRMILGSNKFIDKAFFYTFWHNYLGKGLITSGGKKWTSHRMHIQPYFSRNIYEKMIPTFIDTSQVLVAKLKNTNELNITEIMNTCIFALLHEVILGIPMTDQSFLDASPFSRGHKTLFERFTKPLLFMDFFYMLSATAKTDVSKKETLHSFTERAMKEIKLRRENKELSRWCLLECLGEISKNTSDFTDEDILHETCTFMLAGQDSLSAATCYTLYYLAKHQDVQNKVVAELNDIFEHSSDIDMNALFKMKYLEQCIMETLRLCPSAPLYARKLSEDIQLDKYMVPAGCTVFLSPLGTHHIPQYYPNSKNFDPERFSVENREKLDPFAYLPFSAGPRNCIGSKLSMFAMKTLISTVLRNYKIRLVPGKEDLVTVYRITIRAKGGVWLKLEQRND